MSDIMRIEAKTKQSQGLTGSLGLFGVAGPAIFVIAFIVAGVLRARYSWIHQPVSDLGVGEDAWMVNGSLIVMGVLLSILNIGFFRSLSGTLRDSRRWLCTLLLELSPVGFAVAGAFTEAPSTVAIHWMVGADLAFFGPLAAFLAVGLSIRRRTEWRRMALFSFVLWGATLVLVLVMIWGFTPGSSFGKLRLGGLLERLVIISILSWYLVFGLSIWQRRR